jgi:hypothetical protein
MREEVKAILQEEEYYVCPCCNSLTRHVVPYYKNIFDGAASGFFLMCRHCSKKSYLHIIYPM